MEKIAGIRLYIEDPQKAIKKQIKKSLIIIVGVLVAAGILIFFAASSIRKLAPKLAETENQIYLNLNSGKLDLNLKQNWQSISPYKDKINQALPSTTDLLAYQSALESVAQESGVKVSISFSALPKPINQSAGQKYQTVDHSLEVTGTKTAFNQFVEKIENLPYFVEISSFNVTSISSASASPIQAEEEMRATLSLKVYTK